jgi:hypothetical protein
MELLLKDLQVGSRFRTLNRRRILIKISKEGRGSHPLTKQIFPGSAQHIQHDEKGEIIFVPHCEVRNSSGRKWDMAADTKVEVI